MPDAIDYETFKARHEASLTPWDKLCRFFIWRPKMLISDIIEWMKYRLYCRLYEHFDCLPPDVRDIND